MQSLILGLGTLRGPIFVTFIGSCVVAFTAQFHEVFLALGDADWDNFILGWGQTALFLALLSLSLSGCSLILLKNAAPYRETAVQEHKGFLESLSLTFPLAILFSSILATADLSNSRRIAVVASILLLITIIIILMKRDDLRTRLVSYVLVVAKPFSKLPFWWGCAANAAAVALITTVVVISPTGFADLVGPIGVVFLFLAILCPILSLLGFIYDQYQIPVIGMLVIGAIAWAYIPSNDNHQIRLTATDAPDASGVALSFADWLDKRRDLTDYKGRPYPVYIVTAEGGGIYAAAHAARTLARIQDSCPAFARHVFAVSGVSGGSLGAALFAALVKAYPPRPNLTNLEKCPPEQVDPGKLQFAVQTYFTKDFLTPLLAAGLFPDFLQRFWPLPVTTFDRARALEQSFENGWVGVIRKDRPDLVKLFSRDLRDLWSPAGDQPALLLNTTLVQTGERVIIAPFKLRNPDALRFVDRFVDLLNENYSPTLAAAVSASARFPIVTPPALHWHEPFALAAQLVDGGYYENSGVFTAMNLIEAIRQGSVVVNSDSSIQENSKRCPPNNLVAVRTAGNGLVQACIKLITIRARSVIPLDFAGGDFLSMLAAIYQVRTAKGIANLSMANHLYCGGAHCGLGRLAVNPHLYATYIDVVRFRLPLGWYMSDRSWRAIMNSERSAVDCSSSEVSIENIVMDKAAEEENMCLYSRIAGDLVVGR